MNYDSMSRVLMMGRGAMRLIADHTTCPMGPCRTW
jgi:hypothetical protein